jgi:hypothetical protein
MPPSLKQILKVEGRQGAAFLAVLLGLSSAAAYLDWQILTTLLLGIIFILALELIV